MEKIKLHKLSEEIVPINVSNITVSNLTCLSAGFRYIIEFHTWLNWERIAKLGMDWKIFSICGF
jgi:hypothetical protein